jgi:putative transposase
VTAPRRVLPGKTYLLTRRCMGRHFFLRPSPLTNQLVRYCLATAAEKTGVLIHAICFMSNHWHGVVSDPFGRIPEFLEHFHRLLARSMNVALGRRENFWSSEKPSMVLLVSDEDVLEKMAYTIANPTMAGLVFSPSDWPGVISARFGETTDVQMPRVFFRADGPLPARACLKITRPQILPDLSSDQLEQRLQCAIDRYVDAAREQLRARGQQVVGARTVLRQSPFSLPRAPEPRRRLDPQIASRTLRARVHALRSLMAFRKAYRVARDAWRFGKRDTVFPAGTYALRVHAGVACETLVAAA